MIDRTLYTVEIGRVAPDLGPAYALELVEALAPERALRGVLEKLAADIPFQVSAQVAPCGAPEAFQYYPVYSVPRPYQPRHRRGKEESVEAMIQQAVRLYYRLPPKFPLELHWHQAPDEEVFYCQFTAALPQSAAGYHTARESVALEIRTRRVEGGRVYYVARERKAP